MQKILWDDECKRGIVLAEGPYKNRLIITNPMVYPRGQTGCKLSILMDSGWQAMTYGDTSREAASEFHNWLGVAEIKSKS